VQLTALAVEGVPPQDSGAAGGLVNTTRQVGGAVGLAALATLAGSITTHASAHQSHLQALTAGYRAAFTVSAAVMAATGLLAALLVRRGSSKKTAGEPKTASVATTTPNLQTTH
jgi:MFS family permease